MEQGRDPDERSDTQHICRGEIGPEAGELELLRRRKEVETALGLFYLFRCQILYIKKIWVFPNNRYTSVSFVTSRN